MKQSIRGLLCSALSCLALSAVAAPLPTGLQGVTGEPVALTLDANPTTGYQWMVSGLPRGLLLIPGDHAWSSDCKPGMTGCGGQQTFYLLADKPLSATLKLVYGRTFDKTSWQEKSIRVDISAAPVKK